jgi:hypothetical protein
MVCATLLLASAWVNRESPTRIRDLGHRLPDYATSARPGLHYRPAPDDISGGNTSIRNERRETLAWKGTPDANGFGYFQRNRDLGQTFWTPKNQAVTVRRLILRSGRGTNAWMKGASRANVYLQWFEVQSLPRQSVRINDNRTPVGTRATHGYDMNHHRCDDFIEGVRYVPLAISAPAPLPDLPPTTRDGWHAENRQPGHLRYFEILLSATDQVTLQPDRFYAFLIGFAEEGTDRGLGLANQQWVHLPDPPQLLRNPAGLPWWGIRREGNGQLPPRMASSATPPSDPRELQPFLDQSLFPPRHTELIRPSSDGYPDVDTYRTLEFYLL